MACSAAGELGRRAAPARRDAWDRRADLPLEAAERADSGAWEEITAVDEALDRLRAIDPRAAEVVVLRYFGGLSHEEIGEALGVSIATVKRDWTVARGWLRRELAP